jgi:release factor glutamine methyltransferase
MLLERAMSLVRRRIARRLLNNLRRPYVLARMKRASEVRLLGYRLRTDPNVFHPVYFSSSRILVRQLLELPLRGLAVLDVGTGTGPVALAAAALGAVVTACDVNPRAVVLARENSLLNRFQIEVLESDLFTALSGRRFDLICFNLPFYARDPATFFEAAYNAGRNLETIQRFAGGCSDHLTRNGRVIILFSEDCGYARIVRLFTESGLSAEASRVTRSLLEDFHMVRFVSVR